MFICHETLFSKVQPNGMVEKCGVADLLAARPLEKHLNVVGKLRMWIFWRIVVDLNLIKIPPIV